MVHHDGASAILLFNMGNYRFYLRRCKLAGNAWLAQFVLNKFSLSYTQRHTSKYAVFCFSQNQIRF